MTKKDIADEQVPTPEFQRQLSWVVDPAISLPSVISPSKLPSVFKDQPD